MLEIGTLKKVRNGYSGSKYNPFSRQPLLAFLNNYLKDYSDEGSDGLGIGLSFYLEVLKLWRADRNSFDAFKGLDAEFDATVALFEFLPQLQLLETTESGRGYAELQHFFNWLAGEGISAVKLHKLFMRLDAAEILNRDSIRGIMKTKSWTINGNDAATRTPVSFKYVYRSIKSDIKLFKTAQLSPEEKQEATQKSFNDLFVNDNNKLNFRSPGF